VLPSEICRCLGRELSDRVAAHPRAADVRVEIEHVFARGRHARASDDELRLAAAIVLALATDAESPA